jgi:dolichol-phosphate mannosyltransferase
MTSSPAPEELTIVVPAYNERESLPILLERLAAALEGKVSSWRLVVVDDGSDDGGWDWLREAALHDSRVAALRLSRNFGHQNALAAGLALAEGRAVVTMDADLQHPPEVVPELVARWREGAKVVATRRLDADDAGWFKRTTSRLFYRFLSWVSGERYESGLSDFVLLDRAVVDELLRIGERHLFFRGLVRWIGFRSTEVPFRAAPRARGKTKYSLGRMLDLALTGITAMSSRPLRLGVLGGLVAALLCVAELLFVVWAAFFESRTVPGWASILVVNTFFFAVLFVYLGILGEYIARIFENVKSRPRFIVEEAVGIGRKS